MARRTLAQIAEYLAEPGSVSDADLGSVESELSEYLVEHGGDNIALRRLLNEALTKLELARSFEKDRLPSLDAAQRLVAVAAATAPEQSPEESGADDEFWGAASTDPARDAAPAPPAAPPAPEQPAPSALAVHASPPETVDDFGETVVDVDAELVQEFVDEAREYVEAAEAALLALEADPTDAESINIVFRGFHTIKGVSGMMELTAIAKFAHEAESMFSRIRDGELRFTTDVAGLALKAVDVMRELVEGVALCGEGDILKLPAGMKQLQTQLENAHTADSDDARKPEAPAPLPVFSAGPTEDTQEPVPAEAGVQGEVPDRDPLDEPAASALSPAQTPPMAEVAPKSDDAPNAATATDARAEAPAQEAAESDESPKARGAKRAASVDSSVRVRTERLDALVELVGELVIAQAMLHDSVITGDGDELGKRVLHANNIVRSLQDLSMSLRMVPLKPVFGKLQRVVRDTAKKAGKQVELVSSGDETEIDRNMVDYVGDPLIHMVRNAVDHGIEPAEERRAVGKDSTGTVKLSAYNAGGNVVIELVDNGRGLNKDSITAKAIEKGLIESTEGMSDSEMFALIFEPGFSTAAQVTDVSGRGVGMDVVRRNIEKLNGRIDITSTPGEGTTFSIALPLTLAITDGMLVRVGEERYVVPIVSIDQSFRPLNESLFNVAASGEMIKHRGAMVPLFRLHRVFDIHDAVTDPTNGIVVVVGDQDERTALLVDELLGQVQVVTKALGEGIGHVEGISGGAILGDGRVGLILDPTALIQLARATTNEGQQAA